MKEKKKLYMALLVLAFCLVGAAFLLRNAGLPYRVNAALFGMATTLSCIGAARLLALWSEETSPSEARRNRIENEDERNAALRNRSKALSGDVLQWSLIGLFWLSVGLDAAAVGNGADRGPVCGKKRSGSRPALPVSEGNVMERKRAPAVLAGALFDGLAVLAKPLHINLSNFRIYPLSWFT